MSNIVQKNNSSKIKIAFFDADGTIYHIKTGIANKIKDSLNELREKGILIALNTSRSFAFIPDELKELDFDFISSSNGAYIIKRSEVIKNEFFTFEDVCQLYSLLCEHQLVPILCGPSCVFYDFSKYTNNIDSWASITIASLGEKAIPITLLEKNCCINKICVKIPNNIQIQEELFIAIHKKNYGIIKSYNENLECVEFEVTPCNSTKGTAVKDILTNAKLTKNDSIAFGDGSSDVDMFKEVYISVAMENSSEIIKKHSTYVTSRFDESGVYAALQNLSIINKKEST